MNGLAWLAIQTATAHCLIRALHVKGWTSHPGKDFVLGSDSNKDIDQQVRTTENAMSEFLSSCVLLLL